MPLYRPILSKAILSLFSFILLSYSVSAQTPAQIGEAKAMLGTMTPARSRRKSLVRNDDGSSRGESSTGSGIDLQSYLNKLPTPGSAQGAQLPTVDTTQHTVPQSVVQIVQNPTPAESTVAHPPIDTSKFLGPGGLHYFGYDVFKNIPAAFEPATGSGRSRIPGIGPADVIRVNVWGAGRAAEQPRGR